jgi:hypothetical protein
MSCPQTVGDRWSAVNWCTKIEYISFIAAAVSTDHACVYTTEGFDKEPRFVLPSLQHRSLRRAADTGAAQTVYM